MKCKIQNTKTYRHRIHVDSKNTKYRLLDTEYGICKTDTLKN